MSAVAEDNGAYANTQYQLNDLGLWTAHDGMAAPEGGFGQRN